MIRDFKAKDFIVSMDNSAIDSEDTTRVNESLKSQINTETITRCGTYNPADNRGGGITSL